MQRRYLIPLIPYPTSRIILRKYTSYHQVLQKHLIIFFFVKLSYGTYFYEARLEKDGRGVRYKQPNCCLA